MLVGALEVAVGNGRSKLMCKFARKDEAFRPVGGAFDCACATVPNGDEDVGEYTGGDVGDVFCKTPWSISVQDV